MSVTLRAITLLLLAGSGLAGAQTAPREPDLSGFATQVDALAQKALKAGPLAGIAIGVARGDETLLAKGYGFADLENDVPVTEHTVFRLASVSKQFTAGLVMQLVEERLLSLDDPLSKIAPDFPTGGRTVTLRQLLNHTSGIPSVTSLPDFNQRSETIHSRDELLALVHGKPFDFEPGEEFTYNNSGFILAGAIAEEAGGKPYDELIAERIFAPLQMDDSGYAWEEPVIKRRAQGYRADRGQFVNDRVMDMVIPGGAGALRSSVVDLLKWPRALQRCEILGDASVAEMTTPTRLNDGVTVDYGFGLVVDTVLGQPYVGHGGNIQGFNTWIEWYPELELSIAVLINTEGNQAQEIASRIAKLLIPAPAASTPDLPLAPGLLATCPGTFTRGDRPLVIAADGDHLTLRFGQQPATRLLFQGEQSAAGEADDASDVPALLVFRPAGAPAQRIVLVRSGDAIDHVTLVAGLTAQRFARVSGGSGAAGTSR